MSSLASAPHFDLDSVLDDREVRIIVCTGAGGVGKTTTAAALALRAAERGRRVCVLTIDPARRLAQALGLTHLDNTPRPVMGISTEGEGANGSMEAMMLDMKRTFDEVVEANADAGKAQQILANPFYQALSSSFAGTQEYMAMEKLGQLSEAAAADDRWDLIVVDTPPSRSALDFLDAPARLGSFLDGRFIRILAAPARSAGRGIGRIAAMGFSLFTGVLDKILGAQVLTDVGTFISAIDSTFGGFRERAERTYALLKEPSTRFIVVTAPEPDALREASYFVERLRTDAMPLAGVVMNRMTIAPPLPADRAQVAADQIAGDGPDGELTAALLRLHAERRIQADRQLRLAERFTASHPQVPVAVMPAMAEDVHDLAGLRAAVASLQSD